jgi:hypothetical protein
MGFGQMRFGEGKFDGVEQVVITKKDGDMRALTSVLQNVFDAWMTLLGQPLSPISVYQLLECPPHVASHRRGSSRRTTTPASS